MNEIPFQKKWKRAVSHIHVLDLGYEIKMLPILLLFLCTQNIVQTHFDIVVNVFENKPERIPEWKQTNELTNERANELTSQHASERTDEKKARE